MSSGSEFGPEVAPDMSSPKMQDSTVTRDLPHGLQQKPLRIPPLESAVPSSQTVSSGCVPALSDSAPDTPRAAADEPGPRSEAPAGVRKDSARPAQIPATAASRTQPSIPDPGYSSSFTYETKHFERNRQLYRCRELAAVAEEEERNIQVAAMRLARVRERQRQLAGSNVSALAGSIDRGRAVLMDGLGADVPRVHVDEGAPGAALGPDV